MAKTETKKNKPKDRTPDTVNWNNNDWDSVKIEIRTDHYIGKPKDNPVVALPTLLKGETYTETSNGDGFYWVRLNPPSDGIYIHRPCYDDGSTYDEDIL